MKNRIVALLSFVLFCVAVLSSSAFPQRTEIAIPDIMGYKTLKCDFHMHTVFSDGSVWPTVRVDEAWRDGLDAIAISDHVEYQPHKADIPTNHKRPYEIAAGAAKAKNMLLVKAAEITRDTPPGHFNAIFIDDIAALDTKGKAPADSKTKKDDELILALEAARKQNAIVFWNHPDWQARNGEQVWFDIHRSILDAKLVQGIEVVNGRGYYDKAFQWGLERDLIMFGNSDVHGPLDPPTTYHQNHRTMTLVFVQERTLESLREALEAGRTAIWCDDMLFGREQYLEEILAGSLEVAPPHHRYRNTIYFEITNKSDLSYSFEKLSGTGPAEIIIAPHETIIARVNVNEGGEAHLSYKVTNLFVGPGENLVVSETIRAQ